MDIAVPLLLAAGLMFVMIAVHEMGHFLAGLTAGIPARDMKIVLFAFPQHVALRDGDGWVSPARDIAHYVAVSRTYFKTRWAAYRYVAGGLVVGTAFSTILSVAAVQAGQKGLAIFVAYLSLVMYLINVLLMDIPWALLRRQAAGDTSGLWQISWPPTVLLTASILLIQVLTIIYASRLLPAAQLM